MTEILTVPEHRKLPVIVMVKRSYGYLWQARRYLASAGLAMFALNLATGFSLFSWQISHFPLPGQAREIHFLPILFSLLMIVPGLAFVVGVQRNILCDERRDGLSFFHFDQHLRRYILVHVKLAMILFPVMLFLSFVLVMVGAGLGRKYDMVPEDEALIILIPFCLAVIGFIWLCTRLSLALPAAAVGDAKPIAQSWRATRGAAFRIWAALALAALPLLVLMAPANLWLAASIASIHQIDETTRVTLSPASLLLAEVMVAAVSVVASILFSATLSYVYAFLVRGNSHQPLAFDPAI